MRTSLPHRGLHPTDALFHGEATPVDPVDPHVAAVTEAFAPRSYVDRRFLDAARRAYSVHMGVENAASLLYSLIRFVKPTSVVEVGAGYIAKQRWQRSALITPGPLIALGWPSSAWSPRVAYRQWSQAI